MKLGITLKPFMQVSPIINYALQKQKEATRGCETSSKKTQAEEARRIKRPQKNDRGHEQAII